jgi:hypothetical protein
MPDENGRRAAGGANVLDSSDPAYRGQAVYTARTLRAYDAVVVNLSNSLAWRCPARKILAQYNRHISDAHLDVGPGTGYYLDRCRVPGEAPHITLRASFRSVGLSYVLHCLPGDIGRALMRIYNRRGIFSNLRDDRVALERCLADRFDRYELEVSGAVALFTGWVA